MHACLSVLLLFTAAIVSNIESVQQTLNLTLDAAYTHVVIPVEALIWVRSVVIVLLIVAHALRHVQHVSERASSATTPTPQPMPLVPTPELVEAIRAVLAQVTVTEEAQAPQALPEPQNEQGANTDEQGTNIAPEASTEHGEMRETNEGEQEANNSERVRVYLAAHPMATVREIADALTISTSTANKWRRRIVGSQTE